MEEQVGLQGTTRHVDEPRIAEIEDFDPISAEAINGIEAAFDPRI